MVEIPIRHDADGPFFIASIKEINRPLRFDHDTATLFTHAKKWREVDHIFYSEEPLLEENTAIEGIRFFIFRERCKYFDDIATVLGENDFHHVHAPFPTEVDLKTYEQMCTVDLGNYIPESWEADGEPQRPADS